LGTFQEVLAFVSYPRAYIGLQESRERKPRCIHLHVVTFERGICRITIEIITMHELLEACAVPAD